MNNISKGFSHRWLRFVKSGLAVGLAWFLILPSSVAGAQEKCDDPLPEFTIEPPAADVPEEFAQFSGVWKGKWGGFLCSSFIVTKVDTKGEVKGIYSWGRGRNFDAGNMKFDSEIKDGKIKFGRRAKFTFRMDEELEDLLLGERWSQGSRARVNMLKVAVSASDVSSNVQLAEAPSDAKTFLGSWCGQWSPGPINKLTVKAVEADGSASGVYSWGKGSRKFDGEIEDGVLRFNFPDFGFAKVRYKMVSSEALEGTWKSRGSRSTIKSRRCE